MREENAGTRQLVALDLLRFACAMLVLFYHYGSAFARSPSLAAERAFAGQPVSVMLLPQSWFGWIGVELFFVISGYVIALSARNTAPGQFMRRRMLRLVPAAWICASISAIILLGADIYSGEVIAQRWIGSTLFVPWLPQIDASYWTIGIEVNFYALVALLIWRGGTPALEALPKALALSSALFWAGRLLSGVNISEPPSPILYLLLLPHGCFFALGMLTEQRARGGTGFSATIFVVALSACIVEIINHALDRNAALAITPSAALPLTLFAAGLFIIGNAHRLTLDGRAARIATILGLATYPLYLIHQEAGAVLMAALGQSGIAFPLSFTITTISMLTIAIACTLYAEPPLRRILSIAVENQRRQGRIYSRLLAIPRPETQCAASPEHQRNQ